MKKVVLCARKSRSGSYKGGVVTILDCYVEHSDLFEKNGVNLDWFDYHTKYNFKNSKINNVFYGFAQIRAMIAKLKKESCDVVNIHTSQGFLFLKDVFLAKAIARKNNVKVVLTVHVGAAETVFNKIKPFEKQCICILNRYVEKTVFLSKEIQNQFAQLGVDKARTEVLYNFHCLEKIVCETETNKTFELLFVGAIHKEKGIMELLAALENLIDKPFHFSICGQLTDSSIKEDFEAAVKNLGDKVTLCGYVSGKEKAEIFNKADVLILPSYHEGLPLVILEALASGTAIISTRVGATPEILGDENACWVDIANSKQIEDGIIKMINDVTYLKNMQQANREKSKEFSIEEHIKTLCDIYKQF